MSLRTVLLLSLAAVLIVSCGSPEPEGIIVEVSAGDFDRHDCPIVMDVPATLAGATSQSLSLHRTDTGAAIPVERLDGEPSRAVFLLDEPLEAGQTRRYSLVTEEAAASPSLTATVNDKDVTLKAGDKTILVYNTAIVEPPKGIPPLFGTSGFIHPVYTPEGKLVTDNFPPSHFHQHGMFFAWVDTTFEGRQVDFWNQFKLQGTTEHGELIDTRSGDVYAGFTATRRHIDKSAPDGPKTALNETWTVRAYALDGGFLIDVDSVQRTASESPLIVNEYHYGGMGIRASREWTEGPGIGMLTSEGLDRVEGNHTRPAWAEIFGPLDGSTAGVAAMGSPVNFRHPQPVRLHPDVPYFCFSPMVLGEFSIEPGKDYVSSYRFWVHDGSPDTVMNDRLEHDYTNPPEVRVVE